MIDLRTTAAQSEQAAAAAEDALEASAADAMRQRIQGAIAPYRSAVAALGDAEPEHTYAAACAVEDAASQIEPLDGSNWTEAEAAAAADYVCEIRDRYERLRRYHEAAIARYKRDLDLAERLLVPGLEAYGRAALPRLKRGRTVRLDATGRELQFRRSRGSVRVVDRARAIESVEGKWGIFGAYELGHLVAKTDVRVSGLRELLEADPSALPGIELRPPADKMTIK